MMGAPMRPRTAAWLPKALSLVGLAAFAACTANPPSPVSPTLPSAPMNDQASSHRTAILGPEASPIGFDRIARFPEPGWQIPRNVAFSPDGKVVTYLQSESEAQGDEMALFAFDPKDGSSRVLVRATDLKKKEKPLSQEEELRRERRRQRILGITDYRWAKKANVMVIPFGGSLYARDAAGTITELTGADAPAIDPRLCDAGTEIAFVRKGELWKLDLEHRTETALTNGAPAGVTRGLSDFIAQEEFDEESGFWWSPTCDRIAYLEVDEREVEITPVMGYRRSKADLMQQRYPRAGTKNPKVSLHILDLKTKKSIAVALPEGAERYLGRFQWSADGKHLWFQALTRDQKHLAVVKADAVTGKLHEMWSASSTTWIEFRKLRLLERQDRVVATAVVDGHNHLEVRDASTGARIAGLTGGAWDVDAIAGVDEEKGLVLFTGTMAHPLERRLHAVALAGGPVTTLTEERGVHAIVMARDGRTFVDEHSASDRLPRAVVRAQSGALLGTLPARVDADVERLALRTPKLVEIKREGIETLYGALLEPRHMEPGKRYPVIVMVYGGPGVQTVHDAWAPRLLWQHLADRGFVIFQVDNRGSAGRGPGFQAPIYKKLGDVELADQLAGLDEIEKLPFVDASRVGIYGHSYGGFMTLLGMLRAPERYKVGVSGAPVTDWSLYDTGYTERYMGKPQENTAGYEASDLARLAPKLSGKLLLLHALMDENVHFDHTAHFLDALVAAGKRADLFVFPGERHGYRDPAARKYAMQRVVDYFVENL